MEYMNEFVRDEFKTDDFVYRSELTLKQAKEKYPNWYEKRIVKKLPKGIWVCKKELYEWWKNKIIKQAKTGHRYYCMMMLAVYARKFGVDLEELEKDAFIFMEKFDKLTSSEDNPFTEKDVIDELQSFEDKGLVTYPVTSIANRSGINIEKNKRNYRKQKDHIKIMNTMKN